MSEKRNRLALPSGFRLGPYQLGDQLGAGTFGVTYLANDIEKRRLVAIKELLPRDLVSRTEEGEVQANHEGDDEEWAWAQDRFLQEAAVVSACEHANVLRVYEVFRANGTIYMVSQYEPGCTLREWLDALGRSPNEQELRRLLVPLLGALERVHSRGFLHRDIQPQNVYLTNDKGPLLIDFGSARQVSNSRSRPVTAIVCDGYAPFEQYSEMGHQGPWTDLYGLAAVLYRSVTGQKPPSAPERLALGQRDPCQQLVATFAGQYSRPFLQSIVAAMVMEPAHRIQSAAEWRGIINTPSEPWIEGTTPPDRSNLSQDAQPAREPQRGRDIIYDLRITPRQAVAGAESIIEIDREVQCSKCGGLGVQLLSGNVAADPCSVCRGNGVAKSPTKVRVRLTPGTGDGGMLKCTGYGHDGRNGGAPGDLRVRICVEPTTPHRAAPEQHFHGESAETRGQRMVAAATSILLPGIGSVPVVSVAESLLFLLNIAGSYLTSVMLLLEDNGVGYLTLLTAVALHITAVAAGWIHGDSQKETVLFPQSTGGVIASVAMIIALGLLALAIYAPDEVPSFSSRTLSFPVPEQRFAQRAQFATFATARRLDLAFPAPHSAPLRLSLCYVLQQECAARV